MAIKKMVSEDAVVPETLQGETVKVATIGGKEIKAPVESDSWFTAAINAVKSFIPSWLTPTREEKTANL